MFTLGFDPLGLLLDIANDLYPSHVVEIWCVSELPTANEVLGFTLFPEDGSHPTIFVHADLPLAGMIDIVAHEIAHVVAGEAAGHGEAWETVYAALHDEYMRRISSKTGGRVAAQRYTMDLGGKTEERN